MLVLNVLAIANVPRAIYHGKPFGAFISSAVAIAAFTFLFGAALFPNLIVSSEDAANSLTVSRAASGEKTLEIMLIMATLGMPFVLSYTAAVYWVFRGKVKITPASYCRRRDRADAGITADVVSTATMAARTSLPCLAGPRRSRGSRRSTLTQRVSRHEVFLLRSDRPRARTREEDDPELGHGWARYSVRTMRSGLARARNSCNLWEVCDL
ncbi:MAG TPA: cytochrome d ubiquinol oxidase subunit II [Gemmataceae bacterium]|nr:cytochrome d ubiquinol oxidase subunit II [Gemmataceae bacterium]